MDNMTLEEALAAADVSTTPVNDILMVDAEARTIIVPASEMLFGVRQDMDAERKHFKCPKIVGDNVDLSNCHIYINIFAPFLRKARNTTKVWYCSHASISYLIYLLLGMNGYYAITCIPVRCAIFALVLAIGVLATILIEKLKEKTGWQFFYYMLGESANRRKDKQSYSLR